MRGRCVKYTPVPFFHGAGDTSVVARSLFVVSLSVHFFSRPTFLILTPPPLLWAGRPADIQLWARLDQDGTVLGK